MSIKLLSTIFCEDIKVNPSTLECSLINVRSSIHASLSKQKVDGYFEIPAFNVIFVFARADYSDHCDSLISLDAEMHMELNDKVVPESERACTICIHEGVFTSNEIFKLPRLRLKCIPNAVSSYSFAAILRTPGDGPELARATIQIFIDRRY